MKKINNNNKSNANNATANVITPAKVKSLLDANLNEQGHNGLKLQDLANMLGCEYKKRGEQPNGCPDNRKDYATITINGEFLHMFDVYKFADPENWQRYKTESPKTGARATGCEAITRLLNAAIERLQALEVDTTSAEKSINNALEAVNKINISIKEKQEKEKAEQEKAKEARKEVKKSTLAAFNKLLASAKTAEQMEAILNKLQAAK